VKAVKTYPKTGDYDLSQALQQLGTGEAIITVLSETGAPTPVAWTRLRPPRSLMGQIDASVQQQAVASSPLSATYGPAVDRESAYEKLVAKLAPSSDGGDAPNKKERRGSAKPAAAAGALGGLLASPAFKSFARSAASTLGREISRGLFGTRRR
jgi:uncharacterized protein